MSEQQAEYQIEPSQTLTKTRFIFNTTWGEVIERIVENADQFASLLDEKQAQEITRAIVARYPKVIESIGKKADH